MGNLAELWGDVEGGEPEMVFFKDGKDGNVPASEWLKKVKSSR